MNLSLALRWLGRPLLLTILTVALSSISASANAECSDSKVKRLSRQGKTVSSIARTCDMDVADVRAILEEDNTVDDPPPPPPQSGLPSGAALAPCGCWGPISPGYREANPRCRSGYSAPRMCPQMCPGGGYAWQGACT
jgi:hypothetical protein